MHEDEAQSPDLQMFREAAMADRIIRGDEEIARLRAELNAARAREKRLRAEMDAVAQSTSWRLTAPLRRLNIRRGR